EKLVPGTDAARELRRRAQALDGVRAPAFSDRAPLPQPGDSEPARAVALAGLAANDAVEWNGVPVTHAPSLMGGEHHVRVLRSGRPIWAGWVRVGQADTTLVLPVPSPVPCSLDDIGGVRANGASVSAMPGTLCESWAVARVSETGELEIALCHGASCAAF